MIRDHVVPRLTVCSVLAVLLHLALIPASAAWRLHQRQVTALQTPSDTESRDEATQPEAERHEPPPSQPAESKPEPKPEPVEMLGREDAPMRLRVAWIPFDEFEKVQAPRSRTEQPIVQQLADPVPGAPLEINATAAPPGYQPQSLESTVQVTVPTPPLLQAVPLPESLPRIPSSPEGPAMEVRPGPQSEDAPVEVAPAAETAAAAPAASASGEQDKPAPESPPETSRPTSAPRSDRESLPTVIDMTSYEIKPGQVIVGQGLEVRTAVPRFSQVALLTSAPRNVRASLTFAVTGEVIEAHLITSSGYATVDSPILSSLYKWTATGTRLQQRGTPLELRITILLGADD